MKTLHRLGTFGSLVATWLLLLSASPADAQQKIMVDGSTGTAPLVQALGKAFASRGNASVDIGKGLGTRARFEALAGGKIDIAMASHGLNVDDVRKRGMQVHRIAMTPVVFAVHQSVPISDLAATQICAVYSGRIGNWKDLSGVDLTIMPLARPDSEVDAEVVRDGVACMKDLKFHDSVKQQARAGDMARALADTAGAVGFTSATVVEQSGGKIKALSLDGVEPSEISVLAARYRLTRDAFLITAGAPSEAVKAFIEFVKGPSGAAVIRANGAIAAQ